MLCNLLRNPDPLKRADLGGLRISSIMLYEKREDTLLDSEEIMVQKLVLNRFQCGRTALELPEDDVRVLHLQPHKYSYGTGCIQRDFFLFVWLVGIVWFRHWKKKSKIF